ncbi:polyprenyl diphosphate synthase [Streptomyces sp. NRRL F-6602]|uniref:polyprenyl diphosphate synthase n=1 Tax=Streptomyces sp. SID1143 TaxID=3425889 RepID=UPI0006B459B3|nr:biosynthetic transferase [Streptomyces sp. NRRL F-6602]
MRWWVRCLGTAVRHAALEQARNRLALVLVLFFIPLWLNLAYWVLPGDPVRFFLRAAGRPVSLDANTVTQLSGALHSLALIVGFMMFLATSRSGGFDHRLVLAGYPRLCLLLARSGVLLVTAALTAGYATAWVCAFYLPERLDVMAGAFMVGALTYGGVGILLAAMLRSELAGMFVVIMVSLIDLTLQNPVANPSADSPLLRWLPAYGAVQGAVSAVGLGAVPWRQLLLGLCWSAGLTAAGVVAFTARTSRRASVRALLGRRATGPALRMVTLRLLHPVRARVYRQAGVHDVVVVKGYEICRRLVRRSGPVEAAVPQLFPARLRPVLWAVYGYGRHLDDLSDTRRLGRRDRYERVSRFGELLEADLRRGHSEDPLRAAVVHALWTWDLPGDGMAATDRVYRQDAEGTSALATWEDWSAYWRALTFPFGVRRLLNLFTAPGLAFVPADAEALRAWTDAFNLLDTLRDLREDAAEGFVKLPSAVLDEYGVSAGDLARGQAGGRFADMVHAMTARARQWLEQAATAGAQHPPLAAALRTVVELHLLELDRIDRNPRALLKGPSRADPVRFHCTLARGRFRVARAWRRHARSAPHLPPTVTLPQPAADSPAAPDTRPLLPPVPHAGGARPPRLPAHLRPRHVAIIMDGNGRWAVRRGLPRTAGHDAGQRAVRETVYGALEIGLPCLSLYSLSTENRERPAAEIAAILRLFQDGLDTETEEVWRRDVRLRWSGVPDGLPPDLVRSLRRTEHLTRDRTGLTLNMCVNYGGRDEIAHAARALARQVADGALSPDAITPRHVAAQLHLPDLPDVDLLIRTSGEQRTSNFLPWQSTYAELVFLDTLWPDVDRTHLWQAVAAYARRDRRFGTTRSTPGTPGEHPFQG